MSAPLSPFKVHVADQILAALADAPPMPLSTPALQDRTGYGPRHGQLVYQLLTRLAASGEVEKITTPGVKPIYWRRLAPVIALPPLRVRSDRDRRRPS